MTFPDDYPLNPPKLRFITPMWHPNSCVLVAIDLAPRLTLLFDSLPGWRGLHLDSRRLSLISSNPSFTLFQHPPGDDQYGYEDSGERWLPVHTIESIVGSSGYPIVHCLELMFDSVVERHLSLVL